MKRTFKFWVISIWGFVLIFWGITKVPPEQEGLILIISGITMLSWELLTKDNS